MNNLPPLQLLHIFNVAGRHLSFKLSAQELHVTPSAVSHQIKKLEQHLGFALFRRLNRGLALTHGGEAYLNLCDDTFSQLRVGTSRINKRYAHPQIRASILPYMAGEAVIPNLQMFKAKHPDIELFIETSYQFTDFGGDEVDCAIRYGDGKWPGICAEKLLPVIGIPICSPEYQRKHQLHKPQDIVGKEVIQLPMVPNAWNVWCKTAGVENFTLEHSLSLDSLLSNMQAAEQGVGIAIGVIPLVYPWLESGRVICPFNEAIEVEEGYYFLYREEDKDRAEIHQFKDWVQDLFNQHFVKPENFQVNVTKLK
jgi:LysR family glycine cleavage system transcriptional activator